MNKYKSHKEVHAKPMNRGDYNKDTTDHYESWSPKKQFDEGYTEI
jgi:hypothetical protein